LFKDGKSTKVTNPIEFLFNSTNQENLKMPQVHWHKDLTGKAEDNLMDLLDKLDEKQVPIPLKMWLAAAGIDKDTLIRDAAEDDDLKKALGMPAKEIADPEDDEGFEDNMTEASVVPTSRSLNSEFARGWRSNLLARDLDALDVTKTGKPKHVVNSNAKKRDANWRIAKIAAAVEKDKNYRESLRKANASTLGSTTLKGF
jgi:hypothetical protein